MGSTFQLRHSSSGRLTLFKLLASSLVIAMASWTAGWQPSCQRWKKTHICRWRLLLPRINLCLLERRPFFQHRENRIKAAAAGTSPYRAHYRDTNTGGLSTGLDYPGQIPERNAWLMCAKRQMPQPHICMWGHNFMHTHLCKVAFFQIIV